MPRKVVKCQFLIHQLILHRQLKQNPQNFYHVIAVIGRNRNVL